MKKLIGIAVLAILVLSAGCGLFKTTKYYDDEIINIFVGYVLEGRYSHYSGMEEQEIREHIQVLGKKSDDFLIAVINSDSYCWGDKYVGCSNTIHPNLASDAWGCVLKTCLNHEQENGLDSSLKSLGSDDILSREVGTKAINWLIDEELIQLTPDEKVFGEDTELDEILRMLIPYDPSYFPVWEDESFREKWNIYTSNEYYDETKKKSGELAEKFLSQKVLNYIGNEKMDKEEEIEFFHALIFRWQYEFDKFNECFVPFDSNGLIDKWQDFLINEFRDRENMIEIRDIESLKVSVDLVYRVPNQRDTIRIDEK
ncbi:MAG: hypothetical protein R2883_00600 [Caldisericia bacterium]